MSDARYLSAADTAKIVRVVLKREFPAIKFGVTSETYSGGASISIQWVDGPTTKQVEAHTGPFSGKGFDGMIDLSYSKDAWLMPDGSVSPAKSRGSGNSGGMDAPYSLPAPSPDAELVHFGSGYVHTSRHHSPAFVRRVAAELADKTGWTAPEIVETESYWSRKKRVQTAYFENWRKAEDRQNWEEFSQALYLTPADGPLVTRFDYAFEDHDEEPEPETMILAPERTEAEQIEAYRETLQEIAETADLDAAYQMGYDDEYSDREYKNPYPNGTPAHEAYNRGNDDAHALREDHFGANAASVLANPKTIAHEDRTPEERAEAEALWAETARQIDEPEPDRHEIRVVRELAAEIGQIAKEILAAQPGPFVVRCVSRKVDALGENPTLDALFRVGTDLALIAAKLEA